MIFPRKWQCTTYSPTAASNCIIYSRFDAFVPRCTGHAGYGGDPGLRHCSQHGFRALGRYRNASNSKSCHKQQICANPHGDAHFAQLSRTRAVAIAGSKPIGRDAAVGGPGILDPCPRKMVANTGDISVRQRVYGGQKIASALATLRPRWRAWRESPDGGCAANKICTCQSGNLLAL